METFRITFYKENDQETKPSNGHLISDVVECMALNEMDAIKLFESAEPFATIITIEQI